MKMKNPSYNHINEHSCLLPVTVLIIQMDPLIIYIPSYSNTRDMQFTVSYICWKVNLHPSLMSLADWIRFSSRIVLYLGPSILPSTLTSFPVPAPFFLGQNIQFCPYHTREPFSNACWLARGDSGDCGGKMLCYPDAFIRRDYTKASAFQLKTIISLIQNVSIDTEKKPKLNSNTYISFT